METPTVTDKGLEHLRSLGELREKMLKDYQEQKGCILEELEKLDQNIKLYEKPPTFVDI